MKATIRNFVGLREADLDLKAGTVHIVSGPNASGKTSLAVALGGALAQNSNPLGAAATRKAAYLHDEADAGHVVLQKDDGENFVNWNLQTGDMLKDEQHLVPCSSVAAGLVDFTARGFGEKARQELFEGLFLPPAETLIKEATRELQGRVTPETLKGVLEAITRQGWEGVESVYSDRAREAKSEFMRVAGRNYGVKIAADWRPEGWREQYDGMTVADAQAALSVAEEGVRAVHVASAISQAEHEQAQKEAEKLDELDAQYKQVDEKVQEAVEEFQAQNALINKIVSEGQIVKSDYDRHLASRPTLHDAMQCPNCKVALIMDGEELVQHNAEAEQAAERTWSEKGEELQNQLKELRAKNKVANQELSDRSAVVTKLQEERGRVREQYDRCRDAAEKVKQEVQETDPIADSTAAEQDRAAAEEALRLITAREEAQQAHLNVQQYQFIARILGSKGVRAKAMDSAIDIVNRVLARISEETKWPRVKVETGTYAISIAGRRLLQMCSESERWRTQTALQIAIARIQRDPVIVLDRFDLLDENGRWACLGLIDGMVNRKEPPAVVMCGTEIVKEKSPDHEVLPYIIIGGVLTPMQGESA